MGTEATQLCPSPSLTLSHGILPCLLDCFLRGRLSQGYMDKLQQSQLRSFIRAALQGNSLDAQATGAQFSTQ